METRRLWGPLKLSMATKSTSAIHNRKKTQKTAPKWEETLSYSQITLSRSRCLSVSGINKLCRRSKCLVLQYLRYIQGSITHSAQIPARTVTPGNLLSSYTIRCRFLTFQQTHLFRSTLPFALHTASRVYNTGQPSGSS
jgi:hypothetical protein